MNPAKSAVRLDSLDALRGLAAGMIFLFHFFALYPVAKGAFWEGPGHYIGNFFGMGVPLFFALSALSLYLGYFGRLETAKNVRAFMVRRYFRIAPLFYAAVAAWVAVFISRGVTPSAGDLLPTLSLLFNLFPGKHESFVGAGWSVGVEWLFYMFFPVVCLLITSGKRAFLLLTGTLVLAWWAYPGLKAAIPSNSYSNFAFICHAPYFATGVLVFFFCRRQHWLDSRRCPSSVWLLWAGAFFGVVWLLAGGSLARWLPRPLAQETNRLLWALPIGMLLMAACARPVLHRAAAPLRRFGEWSFSIYLLHPLVIYFINEYAVPALWNDWPPAVKFSAVFGMTTSALLILSYCAYRGIEQPGMQLGKRIVTRDVGGRPAA